MRQHTEIDEEESVRHSKLLLFIVACILITIPERQAVANDLSLTARVEGGIDPATLAALQTLPTVWRPQLAKIVDDTMTRVDVSVKSYLNDISKLITAKLIEGQCHIVATQKDIVDDIVSRIPWARPGGSFEKLRIQIATDTGRMQSESSPADIRAIYIDLMRVTSIVSCQNGDVPAGLIDARKIMDDLGGKWLVWNRAENIGCKAALECLDIYNRTVEQLIGSSDPRDVKTSGGGAAFADYKEPNRSNWLTRSFGDNWFTKRWASSVDFRSIEAALTQLYKIENDIGGSRGLREASAIKNLRTAQSKIDDAKKEIDKIVTGTFAMGGPSGKYYRGHCDAAFQLAEDKLKQPRDTLADAQKQLDTAVQIASLIQKNVDEQAALVATQVKRTTEASAFCKR